MLECVYITRQMTRFNEYLAIYGVYRTEEDAKKELLSDNPMLEFDKRMWRWVNRANDTYYRIDAYTVR